MRGYLNKEQLYLIDRLIGQSIKEIIYYYYEYDDNLKILTIAELIFSENKRLHITYGGLAEDINIIIDFNDYMKREASHEGDRIIKQEKTINKDYLNLIGKTLMSYIVEDEKGYCNNKLSLNFGNYILDIWAELDNINLKLHSPM